MSEHVRFDNNQSISTPLSTLLSDTVQQWLDNDLITYLDYYWHRLRSNGGWELPTYHSSDPLYEPEPFLEMNILPDNHVSLKAPFIVSFKQGLNCAPDELRVFIATRSVVIPASEHIISLLDELNTRESIIAISGDNRLILKALSRTGGLELH